MKKDFIKVWDTEEFRFAFVDKKQVADYYNRYKKEYDSLDEFMKIHCISNNHIDFIRKYDIELEDYYANICDDLQEKYGNGFFYMFSISYDSNTRKYTIYLQEKEMSQKETLVMDYNELKQRLL